MSSEAVQRELNGFPGLRCPGRPKAEPGEQRLHPGDGSNCNISAAACSGAKAAAAGGQTEHQLSGEEFARLQRRRSGNRRAAQRLRQRRLLEVQQLQDKVQELQAAKQRYLGQVYQLAACCQAVLAENVRLRQHLASLPPAHAELAGNAMLSSGATASLLPDSPLTQQTAAALQTAAAAVAELHQREYEG